MKPHCGNLEQKVVDYVLNNADPSRIVSIDLETRVHNGNFLDGERILAVSLSRRLKKNAAVENKLILLEEQTNRGEKMLFSKLNDYLMTVRPLIVVGFNHRGYDLVLLSQKLRKCGGFRLWGLSEMLFRCFHLDVMHVVRFAIARHDGSFPTILSLAKVIDHPMFSDLPLMRTKSIVTDSNDKGSKIYHMYLYNRKKFAQYATGDTHDTLLIFEEIFRRFLGWQAAVA